MLKYLLKDIHGKETLFEKPLKVNFVSSEDAPADSLTVVFAVSGTLPVLFSVEVLNKNERIFYGLVDSQSDEHTSKGSLLTVSARSLACILLDNEALPQTYCMVSMPTLMQRHFIPLGFRHFTGTDKTFDDELVISKGMSEWAVLAAFCRKFIGVSPTIDCYGTIDISGQKNTDILYLSSEQCLSKLHTLKRHLLISDIFARAAVSEGYIMPFEDQMAKELNISKKRYINIADSGKLSAESVPTIMNQADNQYEQLIIESSGCILCRVGSKLILDNETKNYIIKEIHYSLGLDGEKTRIYAEVKYR